MSPPTKAGGVKFDKDSINEYVRDNYISLYWSEFYRIPLNDDRYLSLTEEELLRDVLAIQTLQDKDKLREALTCQQVFIGEGLDADAANEEMSREEFEKLKAAQKETDEMDAELERIFGKML